MITFSGERNLFIFYSRNINFKLPANLMIKIGGFSNLHVQVRLFLVHQPLQSSE